MAWLTQAFNDIAAGKPIATVMADAQNGIVAGFNSLKAKFESNPAVQTAVKTIESDATEAAAVVATVADSFFQNEVAAAASEVEAAVTNLAAKLKASGNTTQAIVQVVADAVPILQAAVHSGITAVAGAL